MKITACSFATYLICFAFLNPAFSKEQKQPNFVIFLADDLGYQDLGCQGSTEIRSPNIDQLAKNGIRFTDAYVTASVCSPSRAGMITGVYQQRFGHESNSPPKQHGMNIGQKTIADRLRKVGYKTALIGKWHLGYEEKFYPTNRGFDYFCGLRAGSRGYFYDEKKTDKPDNTHRWEENGKDLPFDGYLTDEIAQKSIDFIDREKKNPFFLFVSFTAPHRPLHATQEDLALFPNLEGNRKTYAAMIWAMDRAIGNITKKLAAEQLTDNTVVWFLSDNGGADFAENINLPLKGKKGRKFEGGIRVPYIMSWPGVLAKNETYTGLTSSLDIAGTCAALAGADAANLDGVNLIPHLTGKTANPPHDILFWRKLQFAAIRENDWKLIRVSDYGQGLYQLSNDISEMQNLAMKNNVKTKELAQKLQEWENQLVKPEWEESKFWQNKSLQKHIEMLENRLK